MSVDSVLSQFAEATCDLLYMSETDAEFSSFIWTEMTGLPTAEAIKIHEGHVAADTVDVETLPFFFRNVPAEDRPRYDALAALLEATLADLKVFRIGRVRKTCYIIGRVKDGHGWAGLTTEAVET